MRGTPSMPGVTVVVTTYDHAHFLADALDSVLALGDEVAEVVVVDDGSHDAPEQVVARYPGVRLHRQANAGLAAARNAGLAACRTAGDVPRRRRRPAAGRARGLPTART